MHLYRGIKKSFYLKPLCLFLPETLDTSHSSVEAGPSETMISGTVDHPEPSISSSVVDMLSPSISMVDTLSMVEKPDDVESVPDDDPLTSSSGDDEDAADDEASADEVELPATVVAVC